MCIRGTARSWAIRRRGSHPSASRISSLCTVPPPAGTMAFVSPFAHVIRSSATLKYSDAVPFPSLPNPVMTLSNIRSMSCELHISRMRFQVSPRGRERPRRSRHRLKYDRRQSSTISALPPYRSIPLRGVHPIPVRRACARDGLEQYVDPRRLTPGDDAGRIRQSIVRHPPDRQSAKSYTVTSPLPSP